MTLSTLFIVKEPTPIEPLFRFYQSLMGDPATQVEDEEDRFANLRGVSPSRSRSNRGNQGLTAWLIVNYGADGPLKADYIQIQEDDPEYSCDPKYHEPWPSYSVCIDWDTAYGYRAPNGARCQDLHAYFVAELATYCTERRLSWAWHNEYTGEWFTDLSRPLGDADSHG